MKKENAGFKVFEENFVDDGLTNEDGSPVMSLDIWEYCRFFAEKIQIVDKLEDGKMFYEGISLWMYAKKHEEPLDIEFYKEFISFTRDRQLIGLQNALLEYGVKLNALALCNLCIFIIAIIRQPYAIKLRPTPAETLQEVTELEQAEFVMKDGSRTVTNNQSLMEAFKSFLSKQAEENTVYEVDEIVHLEDVMTREYMQIRFFDYMELFLRKRFPIKRGARGNAALLNEEYDLIGYMMVHFQLSPVEVTMARMRQLRMKANDCRSICPVCVLPVNDKMVPVEILFVKYSIWSKGRINPLKEGIPKMQVDDTVYFNEDVKGLERLKE